MKKISLSILIISLCSTTSLAQEAAKQLPEVFPNPKLKITKMTTCSMEMGRKDTRTNRTRPTIAEFTWSNSERQDGQYGVSPIDEIFTAKPDIGFPLYNQSRNQAGVLMNWLDSECTAGAPTTDCYFISVRGITTKEVIALNPGDSLSYNLHGDADGVQKTTNLTNGGLYVRDSALIERNGVEMMGGIFHSRTGKGYSNFLKDNTCSIENCFFSLAVTYMCVG